MKKYTKTYIERIMAEVQNLEEAGGPETLEEYTEVLEKVKEEIQKRIEMAKKIKTDLGVKK